MRLALLFLVLLAGTSRAETPADRAQPIIDAQRALIVKGKAGIKPFFAGLDPACIFVGDMAVGAPKDLIANLDSKDLTVSSGNAVDDLFVGYAGVKTVATVKATASNLLAGARGDALWFTFDLALEREPGTDKPQPRNAFRITEVVVGGKVVLFHLNPPIPDNWDDADMGAGGEPVVANFPSSAATKAGALAALSVDPGKLAKAILAEPSTIVLGSTAADRGTGAAAAKLLGGWSKLKLEHVRSIERTTKDYGYAVVRVDVVGKGNQRMRMFATLIGVPKGAGWQIVTATYSRISWL